MPFFGSSWNDNSDDDSHMSMFSNCSDQCNNCFIHYNGGCIAGHGDNDFHQIKEKDIPTILKNKTGDRLSQTIKELKIKFPDINI